MTKVIEKPLDKAITIQSKYCLSPEWAAVFKTTCPETRKPVSILVCGKAPLDTQKDVTAYIVQSPTHKGKVDTLSLNEYLQLAMLKECIFERENGIAHYSEFRLI